MWSKVRVDEKNFVIYIDEDYKNNEVLMHDINQYFIDYRGDSLSDYEIQYVSNKELYYISETLKYDIQDNTCLFDY